MPNFSPVLCVVHTGMSVNAVRRFVFADHVQYFPVLYMYAVLAETVGIA